MPQKAGLNILGPPASCKEDNIIVTGLEQRAAELHALIESMEFSHSDEKQGELTQEKLQKCHEKVVALIENARARGASVYLIGNGGSAAIVSHAKTDLMNVAGVKAITLLEPAIMTCLSNDYGYENVFSRQIQTLANPDDILIAVSSSGQSENILNAVRTMKNKGASVISLTGFDENNPLRKMGDYNYWLNSSNYTLVEIAHLFVLHHMADCLSNKS